MRSIGVNLEPWVKKGLLRFHALRSTLCGLETHLTTFHKVVRDFQPDVVVIDPLDSLVQAGTTKDATAMLTRLIDFLKVGRMTTLMTNLISGGAPKESSGVDVSSLVDTWISLRDIELGGERNRGIFILKSRGMAHSNQIREFLITDDGIDLQDVYVGPEGVLTGSARQAQEARERASAMNQRQEIESRQRERQRKREALEARVEALQKEFEAEEEESEQTINQELAREQSLRRDRELMAIRRKADAVPLYVNRKGRV
jgi:circadian clock protein KaiC